MNITQGCDNISDDNSFVGKIKIRRDSALQAKIPITSMDPEDSRTRERLISIKSSSKGNSATGFGCCGVSDEKSMCNIF